MTASSSVTIDIISDVMCPWCYIGKRRLETALGQREDIDFQVQWHPFQLDATIPQGGMDRKEYVNNKFGPERAKEIYINITNVGKAENIPFAMDAIGRSPNTVDCHRLIYWAQAEDRQDAVVEHLFKLFFTEGQDIGDHEVLLKVAGDAGMDVDKTRDLLASDTDKDTIQKGVAHAHEIGVQGVPFFIVGGKYAVSGAQDPASLLQVVDKVLEEAREADQS